MKNAYTINEAAEAIGIGRTLIYKKIGAGELEAVKCGNRTLITAHSIERFIESLPRLRAKV